MTPVAVALVALIALAEPGAPSIVELQAKNGVRVLHTTNGPVPWTSFRITIPLGAASDPAGKAGLAKVAALTIAASLDSLDSLSIETGHARTIISGGAPEAQQNEVLEKILATVASPKIDEPTVRRAVERAIQDRRAVVTDDRRLAMLALRRALYGDNPLARDPSGDVQELASISPDDVRAVLRQRIRAGSVAIAVATQVAPDAMKDLATDWTAGLPAGATADGDAHAPLPASLKGRRVVVVDKPGRSSAYVLIGAAHVRPGNISYASLLAADGALSKRSMGALARSLKGAKLSGITLASGPYPGPSAPYAIAFEVETEKTARAMKALLETLDRIERSGLETEDIKQGRLFAAGRAALDLRSPSSRVAAGVQALALGLPASTPVDLPKAILASPDESITTAARALAAPDGEVIVIVTSVTPSLQRELAALPRVKDVSVVGYDER